MSVWKRNAVVVAIVLFVGAAVYLNWSYSHQGEADTANGEGKVLGQTELVNGKEDASPAPSASASAAPDASPAVSGSAGGVQTTGYFASARLNRQQARDSALQLLQEAASDANAQQSVVDEANASIQTMAAYTMSEAQVENLVTAKGYGDCVCFLNENSASVVVSATAEGLTENDTAKILEIVMDKTGLAADHITILEAEP